MQRTRQQSATGLIERAIVATQISGDRAARAANTLPLGGTQLGQLLIIGTGLDAPFGGELTILLPATEATVAFVGNLGGH